MPRLLPAILRRVPMFACAFAALATTPAMATYSIIACDDDGACGVAVATHNLAVGASVPYAKARVGALAVQFETDPVYGTKGLTLLAEGVAPAAALAALLAADRSLDGTGIGERQVGIVDARGASAIHTGGVAKRSTWAGGVEGRGFAVQGNGLAGARVVEAMAERYRGARGAFGERLLAALEAGHAAGGQTIGAMSAALLVRTPEGDWQDIDLRVDGSTRPLQDLRRLLDQRTGFDLMLRAEREQRAGRGADAKASRDAALARAHDWDRLWRRAARLSMGLGDSDAVLRSLARFHAINPGWAEVEMQDVVYDALRDDARFIALRSRQ
ncbi:DUF1028 domain-containing protein [Dokdonella sp. MW10]|uniref:DUF1028 domain-containing protein n=1 Tax=Dokdonella sp. MW10 TaxID=2992926 RepID=UPI003F81AF26